MKYKKICNIDINNITPHEAWVFGFFASDGHLKKSSRKGDPISIVWDLNIKDIDVLQKVRTILNVENPIHSYHYERNSVISDICVFGFASQEHVEIFEKLSLKNSFPTQMKSGALNRHFLRGLFDGDGCIHFHKKRKSVMANFINQEKQIVKEFIETVFLFCGIKKPNIKYIEHDHIYSVTYEARAARLLLWYLYHGDIEDFSMKRKKNLYHQYVSNHIDAKNSLFESFFQTIRYKPITDKNGIYLPMTCGKDTNSLDVCKSFEKMGLMVNLIIKPVFKNKGCYKYYQPYIPRSFATNIDMLRPFLINGG